VPAPRKYPNELRERALRLVYEAMAEDPELSLNAAVHRIGPKVNVVPDTLRGWTKQARGRCRLVAGHDLDGVDEGQGPRAQDQGARARERDFARGLVFLRAGARPATSLVVEFIDDHRDRFGVEPICDALAGTSVGIAPSTYYAAKVRPPSARQTRDERVLAEVVRVHGSRELGRGLYGSRKVWHQLKREQGVDGVHVPKCQVERLMRRAGLQGVSRGRTFKTTRPDPGAARPADLVERQFRAGAPNKLWLVDFTYVPTWSGMAFTAFVFDACSQRVVGWRTAAAMPTQLPLDALEMALWNRGRAGQDVAGVVHHSDAGSTPPSATPTGSSRPALSLRSVRSGTATTLSP
jgi:putative transposase